MSSVVIAGAKRSPIGSFQGSLSGAKTPDLGGAAIKAALEDAKADASAVQELFMGCVLPAGLGQAPARQAGFAAGLDKGVPATTVNKVCGSGMRTVMMAADQIRLGSQDVVVAGGMESMTNAPYLQPNMRGGARLGHKMVMDHMFLDGLEDAYDAGSAMGVFAESNAEHYQFTREQQDAFALETLDRALRAQQDGSFAKEIAAYHLQTRKGEVVVEQDEQPLKSRPDKIPTLKPAFKQGGTVTAANASSISDGAAAMVLASEAAAEAQGLNARARIVGYAGFAQEPAWFTTAPVPATQRLLDQIGWSVDDVDLFEVNEAFAVVPMAYMKELGVEHERLNIFGGACALGHPIGTSGTRIIVTLLNALEQRGLNRGVAAICIGGGEGTAIAIERF